MSKIMLILPIIIAMSLNSTCELGKTAVIEEAEREVVNVVEQEVKEIKEEPTPLLEEIKEEEKVEEKKELIVNFDDVRVTSNASAEDLNKFLVNTGLAGMGQAYIDAESIYGVNAVILMALTIEESGWGESAVAEAYNNISGTMIRGAYKYFNSFYECVDYTARNLGNNYLKPDGIYHNGYSLAKVNLKYCFKIDEYTGELVPDLAWHKKIESISNEFLNFYEESVK